MNSIKHYWRRAVIALAAVGLVVGSLAGCGASDSDCQGDKGKVTAKDSDSTYNKSTKTTTWDYELTILKEDGSTYEKDVSSTAYDWYKVGGKFPHPTKCTADGKAK